MPRLTAVTLVAHRIAPSVEFYRRLGLDLPTHRGGYVAELAGSDVRLCFVSEELGTPRCDPRPTGTAGGRLRLSFRFDDPADVDEVARRLEAAGGDVHGAPFDAPWGARCCRLLDPEGNPVELFAPLP